MRIFLLLVACGDPSAPPDAECPRYAATGGGCSAEGASCDYGEATVSCIGGLWTCTWGNCCPCNGMLFAQSCQACADLASPLNGCKSLLPCYQQCNPGDQPCFDACDAGGTPAGVALLKTLSDCIDQGCFVANDGGMPPCTDATLDDPLCKQCYDRIFAPGSDCSTAESACNANGP